MLPSLPRSVIGDLGDRPTLWTRQLSIKQTWDMYAPDPERSHSYIAAVAEFPDGHTEPLEEALQAESGWDHIWDWQKRRIDIWRVYTVMSPEKPNPHRTWYVRSLCVREALLRGEPPQRIITERVRRGFTRPERVRAGEPPLGPVSRVPLMTVDCRTWPVRDMIAEARARAAR